MSNVGEKWDVLPVTNWYRSWN